MKTKHFFSLFLCLIAATLQAQITITPRGISTNTFSTITTAQDSYFNTIRVGTGVGNNPFNVVVGTNFTLAANNSDAGGNVAISHGALQRNTSGVSNLSVGVISSNFNTTGSYNTVYGSAAFYLNTTGSYNTAVGRWALYNSRGNRNIALGNNAGFSITTGSNNVVIGSSNGSRIATRSNVMLFSDGIGNERFAVDSLGNMSIATTQAPDRLNVRGRIYSFGPSGGIRLGDQTDTTRIWSISSYANQKLQFEKNFGGGPPTPLTIDGSTGFLGINQPTPTAHIDVLGNGRFFGGSLTVTPFFGVGGAVNFRSSASTSDFSNFYNSWTGSGAARKLRFSYQHKNPEDAFAAENAVMEIQGSNLEFLGNTRFPNSFTIPLNAAAGRLLQSDGSGNASWMTPNYGVLSSSNTWSASNTFSGGSIFTGSQSFTSSTGVHIGTSANFPWIGLRDNAGTTDNKNWDVFANGTALQHRIVNDALTSASVYQQVIRSGINVSSISFPNGNVGIGTTTPLAKFEIKSSSTNNLGGIMLRATSTSNFPVLIYENASNGGTIDLFNSATLTTRISSVGDSYYNTGNVGIGTTTPNQKLELANAGAVSLRLNNSAANTWDITNSSPSGQLWFTRGGSNTHMIIDQTGNVGVGITPTNKFDVSAGTNMNARFLQLAHDNYANEGVGISMSRISSDSPLMALGVVDSDKLGLFSREGLVFGTGGASTYASTTEAMRIASNGNVGIGTANPNVKLHVQSGAAGSIVTRIKNADGFGIDIIPQSGGSGTNTAIQLAGGESISFNPNNAEAIRITANGNTGIGTTSPTARLHVLGASPASVNNTNGTNATNALTVTGGAGGAVTATSGTVTGGKGSIIRMVAGAGGAVSGTPSMGFGGSGGDIDLVGGDGGNGTTFGGTGGLFNGQGGNGGFNGSGGPASIKGGNAGGGNGSGGDVFLIGGIKSGTGVDGNIFLGVSPSMTIRGNVGIGVTTASSKLTVGGDIELTSSSNRIILVAPNGTKYAVTVNNSGVLTTTAL